LKKGEEERDGRKKRRENSRKLNERKGGRNMGCTLEEEKKAPTFPLVEKGRELLLYSPREGKGSGGADGS